MTPEEVESRITAPIELELLGIPRQTMLRIAGQIRHYRYHLGF